MSSETRPREGGLFSKEVFHVLEPPYLVRALEEDLAKVALNIMTRIMELGCIYAWLIDDVLRRESDLAPPQVELQQAMQAVLEQDEWKNKCEVLQTKYNKKQGKLSRRKLEHDLLAKKVEELQGLLEEKHREVEAKGQGVVLLEAKLKGRDDQVAGSWHSRQRKVEGWLTGFCQAQHFELSRWC